VDQVGDRQGITVEKTKRPPTLTFVRSQKRGAKQGRTTKNRGKKTQETTGARKKKNRTPYNVGSLERGQRRKGRHTGGKGGAKRRAGGKRLEKVREGGYTPGHEETKEKQGLP